MQMIATGQLFAPYFFHPDADGEDRRAESRECLELLEAWIDTIDRRKLPKNMAMDWDGEWLSRDFIKNWNKDYEIPDVEPHLVPTHHPTKYAIQKNATSIILPAKGILPVGSFIRSPRFGLIHPTTISAAVLQDAGFQVDPEDSCSPVLFDAITLAPSFDFVCGGNRLIEMVNFITQWILNEPEEDDTIAYTPPDELSFVDFMNFRAVPLNKRDAWDGKVYTEAFELAANCSEDQWLAFHMAPMLNRMGINVRATRAGLEKTPLRDALSNLHSILNEVIDHAWLREADFETLKNFVGDRPGLAEAYSGRRFRQLLWDLVGL